MFDETKTIDRRSFLRGSALFATALGLSVVPALAQEPQQKPGEKEKEREKDKSEKSKEGKLIDKDCREYRDPSDARQTESPESSEAQDRQQSRHETRSAPTSACHLPSIIRFR